MNQPVRILFVCTANICRSAYADVRARSLLGDRRAQISSAGTWGFDAAPMDDQMAAQATARGMDPSLFRSQRVTAAMVNESDVVLAMAAEHRTFLLEDWPGALAKTFTITQFSEAIAQVDPGLRGVDLVKAARAVRNAPHRAGDIADPYRKGASAAAACAQQLDDLLTQIVPRLAR